MTVISIVLNLLNMYTDYALAIVYITGGDLYFGVWTLGIVVVPSLLISLFTFILHKKSKGQFLMKVHFSRPFVYTLCALLHGHVARCLMWLKLLVKKETLFGVRKALWAFRDITSYAETFIHSLPQLCLQLYVMVIYTGKPTPLQYISFVSSWISAAWAIQSQFDGLKWKLLSFEINLCWFASRATATFMIASVNKAAPFLLYAIHLLLMFPLWFYQNKIHPCRKKRGTTRFELIYTDVFYAGIYAASNTVTPITCKYQLPLAAFLLVENLICIGLGFRKGKVLRHTSYFRKHRKDYNDHYLKNTTQTDNCMYNRYGGNNFKGTESAAVDSGSYCLIDFSNWNKSSVTIILACTVAVLGFIQVFIVVLLRHRKVIDEEAMVSKLGSFELRKKPSNKCNDNDNKLVVVTATTSEMLTPKSSPVGVAKKPSHDKDDGRSSDGDGSLPSSSYPQKNKHLNTNNSSKGDMIENITSEKTLLPRSYNDKDGNKSSGESILSHSDSSCHHQKEFSNLNPDSSSNAIDDISFEKGFSCPSYKDDSKSSASVSELPSHKNNTICDNANNLQTNKDCSHNSDGKLPSSHSNNKNDENKNNLHKNEDGNRDSGVSGNKLPSSHSNNITDANKDISYLSDDETSRDSINKATNNIATKL